MRYAEFTSAMPTLLSPNGHWTNDGRWRPWVRVVLINFLIAATVGVILRYAYIADVPWLDYTHWLHAHSHLAMLGWLYGAIFIMIVRLFNLNRRSYSVLFWLTDLAAIAMFVAFMKFGYAPLSITFTGLHLMLSYIFTIKVLRGVRSAIPPGDPASTFLKGALFFLILSTLGAWMLGPIMAAGHAGTALYFGSIQFFLHFQLNGWFLFAMLALFFRFLSKRGVTFPNRSVRRFFIFLLVSCLMTFALAVTWSMPERWLFTLNSVGVILQLIALFQFLTLLRTRSREISALLTTGQKIIWLCCLMAFAVKVAVQGSVAIPYVAVMSYTVHNFVIGFIHLITLGCTSLFLFGLFEADKLWLGRSPLRWVSIALFITSLSALEVLLFYQGLRLWVGAGFLAFYFEWLVAVSAGLLLSVAAYVMTSLLPRNRGRPEVLSTPPSGLTLTSHGAHSER